MEGKYYFSKIELFDNNEITLPGLKRKADRKKRKKLEKLEKRGILIGKDPIKLLQRAQRCNTCTAEVSNPDQLLRKKWTIAMLRAQGCKVKDNMQLLKKSSNKLRKLKRKKQEKWQERNELVEQTKREKQAKRQSNIRARSNRKLSQKLKRAKSRGRVLQLE
ncbi:unnamed protein product [Calicophoron daubneyi]|uniref:Ribosomal RNA-processing protein 14/surfeit locus protein 6 C-terminal domain-containing protein n=1 Tax=Calicophoron daubneyi TaxID=300641 RepID=A0AAV2TAR3_CALDB